MQEIKNQFCYFSGENQSDCNMSINYLSKFIEFIETHRSFYLTIESYTDYPNTGVAPEHVKDLPQVENVVVNCNGLTIEEFEMVLEKLTDETVFFIQDVYANFETTSGYFLDVNYNKLKELYKQIADIDSSKKKRESINIKIKIDPEFEKLSENDFTPEHRETVKQYLLLHKHYIEKVIQEYEEAKKLMENKPSKPMGFKFGNKK